MEVHTHSHMESLPAGKAGKKFTHYLWEFLMLFLAVFCGFLAENLREYKIENEREKQFMQSLVRDIQKDLDQGDSLCVQNNEQMQSCDSILNMLTTKEIESNSYPLYHAWLSINGFDDFVANDGTTQQLKNSGALRLVKKRDVVNRLLDYSKAIELIKIHQAAMDFFQFQKNQKAELFNIPRLDKANGNIKIPLLSTDRKLISWGYDHILTWKGLLRILNGYIEDLKTRGKDLKESIRKEYKLK